MKYDLDDGGKHVTQITLTVTLTRNFNTNEDDDGCAISRFALFTTDKSFNDHAAGEFVSTWKYFKNSNGKLNFEQE